MVRRTRPAASWRGFSTGMATMVVQLDSPRCLRDRVERVGIDLGHDEGTAGSIRHAEELSTTIAPEAAILGERTLEEVAPAEHSAMSMPEKSAVAASSTMICRPPIRGGCRPSAPRRKSGPRRAERRARRGSGASPRRLVPSLRPLRSAWPTCYEVTPAQRNGVPGGGLQSRPKAVCSAPTASSTTESRTTHEMRIDEVEIISMLIDAAARVSNMVAVTPG